MCKGITKSGSPCRRAPSHLGYCFQHLNQESKDEEKSDSPKKRVKKVVRFGGGKAGSKATSFGKRTKPDPIKVQERAEKIKAEKERVRLENEKIRLEKERLKREKLKTILSEKSECPICLDCVDKTSVMLLECGHFFHTDCLGKMSSYDCPMCRKDFQIDLDAPMRKKIAQNYADEQKRLRDEEDVLGEETALDLAGDTDNDDPLIALMNLLASAGILAPIGSLALLPQLPAP